MDRERDETVFYGGRDYQLGKDRAEQVRAEVQHNRLEASLAKGARLQKAGGAPTRSVLARGAFNDEHFGSTWMNVDRVRKARILWRR